MKWLALPALVALAAVPTAGMAQRHVARASAGGLRLLPIGHIVNVDDRSATLWGMSGMGMIQVKASVGSQTPITRTETWDARMVEILSRTQVPPLRARDIRHVNMGGRDFIAVRRYMLLEVMPQDAQVEGTNKGALASKWTQSVRRVVPQVAPMPSRFGV